MYPKLKTLTKRFRAKHRHGYNLLSEFPRNARSRALHPDTAKKFLTAQDDNERSLLIPRHCSPPPPPWNDLNHQRERTGTLSQQARSIPYINRHPKRYLVCIRPIQPKTERQQKDSGHSQLATSKTQEGRL